ncbi:MarR family winged helix-turn-helix transcriptional regulator [Hyphomicrobium nitrativorans]
MKPLFEQKFHTGIGPKKVHITTMRDTKDEFGSLERSPLHLLHRADQCATDLFLAVLQEDGLTPRQFAVLSTIAKFEGLSQTHLVERTGIDRSTVADITQRLLKRGLIQRRRTREDARAYAVTLTELGWNRLKAAAPYVKRVDEAILAALADTHRERFVDDLIAIVDALQSKPDTPE